MPRFLTPAKIGLLALIEVYTDAIVPDASTITILSFILNQVLPATLSKSQTNHSAATDNLPFILNLKSFETILSAHPSASGLPGRTLWHHFLKKIWDIDSLYALHDFFSRRSHLLAKTREDLKNDNEIGIPPPSPDMILLSHTSPFGSFVRRSKVEFERSRFSDAVSLWTSFVRWRHESRSYWAIRHGEPARWTGEKSLIEGQEEWGVEATEMLETVAYGGPIIEDSDNGRISTDDVEKLLEFQVEQMQSKYAHR